MQATSALHVSLDTALQGAENVIYVKSIHISINKLKHVCNAQKDKPPLQGRLESIRVNKQQNAPQTT